MTWFLHGPEQAADPQGLRTGCPADADIPRTVLALRQRVVGGEGMRACGRALSASSATAAPSTPCSGPPLSFEWG